MSWSQIDSIENCQIAASPPSQGGENNTGVHHDDNQRDGLRFLRHRKQKNIPEAITRAKNNRFT
jgi:hypothetical protein